MPALKRYILYAVLVNLCLQALIPLGFMPSSLLTETGFVQICPQQQPLLIPRFHPSHHGSMHSSHSSNEGKDPHAAHSSESTYEPINKCQWAQGFVALLFIWLVLLLFYLRPTTAPFRPPLCDWRQTINPVIRGPPR